MTLKDEQRAKAPIETCTELVAVGSAPWIQRPSSRCSGRAHHVAMAGGGERAGPRRRKRRDMAVIRRGRSGKMKSYMNKQCIAYVCMYIYIYSCIHVHYFVLFGFDAHYIWLWLCYLLVFIDLYIMVVLIIMSYYMLQNDVMVYWC